MNRCSQATANHRLDGAFWPRSGESGTPERSVVLLEGRQEGEARGEARGRAAEAAAMAIRHHCPYSGLADALLDFAGTNDLASWLAEHAG